MDTLRSDVKRIDEDVDTLILRMVGIDVGPERASDGRRHSGSAGLVPRADRMEAATTVGSPHQMTEPERECLLGLLTQQELSSLRAASWHRAFLLGLGTVPPQRAAPHPARAGRRPTTKQRPYGRMGFGSGLPLSAVERDPFDS